MPTTFKRRTRRTQPARWNPKGSLNPLAVLTEGEVIAIRQALADGANRYALAQQYGVTPSNIRAIAERRSWQHL